MIGQVITLVVFILLSGLFSSSEIAMFSLSDVRIKHLLERKVKGAKLLHRLKSDSHKLLITILIGNNIVNIGASAIATSLSFVMYPGKFGVAIVTGIMTFVILIVGEIIPKAIATKHSKQVALFMAPLIAFTMKVFMPLVWFFNKITIVFVKENSNEPIMTEEEVCDMLKISEEEGSIKKQEGAMIRNIFNLDDTTVTEVMTPRPDVFAFPDNMNVGEVREIIKSEGYSRIPVYQKDLDNVIGILYAKDLLNVHPETPIRDITRGTFFVHENKRIDSLLVEFKQKKTHLAIVISEHGVMIGIVSIEDLLEEIVGEIYDEMDTDDENHDMRKLKDGSYLVHGSVVIGEVSENIQDLEIPEGDYDTISGFVMEKLNRIPEKDDMFVYQKHRFIVKEVDHHRPEKILIKKAKI